MDAATATAKYDVFLSHNSADKPAVLELARRLQADAGIEPFIDAWHLVPGAPWQEAIEEAIDTSSTCAVFLGPAGFGTWENEEMRAALSRRASEQAFRVIPVLLPGAKLPERGRLPRFLSRLTWVDFRTGLDDPDAFHRLVSGIRGIAPSDASSEALAASTSVCPFRGLDVFDEDHAEFFFGREALVQHLVEQLRTDRFLAVMGPSGSGKSSVVRAGLIPQLRGGALPGSATWPIAVVRPGPHPFESLAARLAPLVSGGGDQLTARDSVLVQLQKDERGLHVITQVALGKAPVDARIVIVVDQFEEIFTLCHNDEVRAEFVRALLYASSLAGGQTVVVVTMRADFFGKAALLPDLADRLAERDVLVTPLDANELHDAILKPAERVGLDYEKGLVETILADLGSEPGMLPLLQHTLLQLWEGRRGRWLTTDRYREIGGVRGAIAQQAETEYARFTPAQQVAARRILLRLTQPGEGTEDTRRRAPIAELLPAGGGASDAEAVIQRLADARLLITDRDDPSGEIVDVAHEALIRGWPRLQGWVDENPAGLRIHRRLTEAAEEWTTRDRDPSFLYQGTRLTETAFWSAQNRDDLNALERDFLDASLAARDAAEQTKRRRTRTLIGGLVAAVVIFGVLGLVAVVNWQAIGIEERRGQARLLVSTGQNLAAVEPLLGMRVALEGLSLADVTDTRLATELAVTVADIAREGRVAYLGTDADQLFSAAGSALVVVSRTHGQSELRRVTDGAVVAEIDGRVTAEFHGEEGHPGVVVLTGDGQGSEVRLVRDGAKVLGPGVSILGLGGDANETAFVVSYGDTTATTRASELRRTSDGSLVAVLDGVAIGATFSPDTDSRSFVVTYEGESERATELRRTNDGALLARLSGETDGVRFSPDPKASVFVPRYLSEPGELRRSVDGSVVATLAGTFGEAGAVAFNDDGSILTVGFDGEPIGQILRTSTGEVVATLDREVYTATYAPGGDGPVLLQYADGDEELRSTRDGHLIAQWTNVPFTLRFPGRTFLGDPGGRYFAIQRSVQTELRSQETGEIADVPTSTGTTPLPELVRLGGDPDTAYVLSTYPDGHRELRPIADLTSVERLGTTDLTRFTQSSASDGVFWPEPPDAAGYVVDNGTAPAEVRRMSDGTLVQTLTGSLLDDVVYSPDGRLAIVRSASAPGELVRLDDGHVTVFHAAVTEAHFSADSSLAVVTLDDGFSELWDTTGGPMPLVNLGLRLGGEAFVPGASRVATRYLSGDAYLVDPGWLQAMHGQTTPLTSAELAGLACSGPLAQVALSIEDLRAYIHDDPPRACQ